VILAASSRYGNVLDYAGPNLSSTELHLSTAFPPPGQQIVERNASGQIVPVRNAPVETATPAQLAAGARKIATGLGAQLLALESPNAQINGTEGGRDWSGAVYVATPQLLAAYGIRESEIDPNADILTSRPGLSGVSGLDLQFASNKHGPVNTNSGCTVAAGYLAHPVIEELGALPAGTSAPNTVITEHAMDEFHISTSTMDWLVQGNQPFTASQISNAELTASASQLSVESKNDEPTSSAVVNTATLFGVLIALAVLAMSVGLVRSETASDLRTLAATGASSHTRRALTAVTAGALGFLGALLGVLGGYIGMIGWLRSNSLNGGIAALGNVPIGDLLFILLAMPAFAAVVGWLFAGREPASMAHQAIE
jgi:putative ABC transport system permease protein